MRPHKKNGANVRKIQQSNGSFHISIPIEIIRNMKWKERQKVVVKSYGHNKIIIVDWKK